MRALEKNIKGFNILEVLITLVIIGIVSAAALPNFNSWKKEREVRGAAVKIKGLFTNITSQVQRGHYAFVQVHVEEEEGKLTITSKGLGMEQYAEAMRVVDNWKTDFETRCAAEPTASQATWIDVGGASNNPEVSQIEFSNVMADFEDSYGTVCFSKDGTWYSGANDFLNGEGEVISGFWICENISDKKKCESDKSGNPMPDHTNVFEIGWSRFGNITIEKWSGTKWVLQ